MCRSSKKRWRWTNLLITARRVCANLSGITQNKNTPSMLPLDPLYNDSSRPAQITTLSALHLCLINLYVYPVSNPSISLPIWYMYSRCLNIVPEATALLHRPTPPVSAAQRQERCAVLISMWRESWAASPWNSSRARNSWVLSSFSRFGYLKQLLLATIPVKVLQHVFFLNWARLRSKL
jgi:hypothetical protein